MKILIVKGSQTALNVPVVEKDYKKPNVFRIGY